MPTLPSRETLRTIFSNPVAVRAERQRRRVPTTRYRVRAHAPSRHWHAAGGGSGRTTASLCAVAQARATGTNRPAIVAHAATRRANVAEHGHAPGPAAGASRKAGCHSPSQGHTRQRGVARRTQR